MYVLGIDMEREGLDHDEMCMQYLSTLNSMKDFIKACGHPSIFCYLVCDGSSTVRGDGFVHDQSRCR